MGAASIERKPDHGDRPCSAVDLTEAKEQSDLSKKRAVQVKIKEEKKMVSKSKKTVEKSGKQPS